LVSEWMEKGTLRSYMNELSAPQCLGMVTGIADGLNYLHSMGVIHGDLRTENIYVSSEGSPLLADFGLSRVSESSTLEYAANIDDELRGSTRWFAIELVAAGDGIENVHQTKQSDVWQFGMTIYELLTKDIPYKHLTNDAQVLRSIADGTLPSCPVFDNSPSVSPYQHYMWRLCNTCWNRDPQRRPDMSDIARELNEVRDHDDPLAEMAAIVSILRPGEKEFDPSLADPATSPDSQAQLDDALATVASYREFSAARPDEFNPLLAGSLVALSTALKILGRPKDAIVAVEEAVELWRPFSADSSAKFKLNLSRSLRKLSRLLKDEGRLDESEHIAGEAEKLERDEK